MEFSVCGKSISSAAVTPTNGVITYAIPQDVMIIPVTETVIGIQVIGHNGDTIIKSPIVKARISNSLQDSSTVASDSPVDVETRVEQLEAVKHTHANKSVLDKFAESDGKPTYGGQALGGGASTAEGVSYTNTQLPNVENVKGALDAIADTQQQHEDDINVLGAAFTELDKKAHTHANKDILDELSVSDGKLQYNGSDVGLKGDKGDTGAAGADGYTPVKGTDYWTASDKAEIVDDVIASLPDGTEVKY